MSEHHNIFGKFKCFEGEVKPGFQRNFTGAMLREEFFLRKPTYSESRLIATEYPKFDNEYFEWIDILESVTGAKDKFTMVELGAGYGRWLVNAAMALRSYSNLPCLLIGVEAEPTHFRWLKQNLRDNGIKQTEYKLIRAAISDKCGKEWFNMGYPREWYGQAILAENRRKTKRIFGLFNRVEGPTLPLENRSVKTYPKKVKAVSLKEILYPLNSVDLIDIDIQGAELKVLENSKKELNQKVKKVHIGTHGQDIEDGLRKMFNELGWKNINDYPHGSINETPYGKIKFGDGVQTWVNPRFIH
ncbi:FkbM family methyltransferase [Nanoarchaeota archaeon]